jgi:YesN/AraC family two-component response regulator
MLTIPVHRQAVKTITEDTKESRLVMLQHTRELMDKYLTNIDDLIQQIGYSENLNEVIHLGRMEEGSKEIYNIWDFSRYLSNISTTNFVSEFPFSVYMKNSGVVFSNNKTTYDFNQFYNDSLKYDDMTYDEWYKLFFNKAHFGTVLPSQGGTYMGEKKEFISYINTVPLLSKTNDCVILFMIDKATINSLMSKYQVNNEGWFYVINKEGKLITKSSKDAPDLGNIKSSLNNSDGYLDFSVFKNDAILTYTNSAYNDWTYIYVIPKDAIMSKVRYIKLIAEGVAGITFIIGLIISYILAYRNSKPFREMINTFRNTELTNNTNINIDSSKNEYKFIQTNIAELINSNKSMKDSLRRHSDTLKNIFLERILKGEFENKNNLETLLTYAGVGISGSKFVVAVIKINRLDNIINKKILEELDLLRILIEDILHRYLNEKGYSLILNENEMALIFSFSSDDENSCVEEINHILGSVKNEFEEKYHVIPAFGIGQTYSELMDLHNSFREANQALEYFSNAKDNNQLMSWYKDIKEENISYFYPYDLEIKLVNYAKSGNYKEIEVSIDRIYNENYKIKSISHNVEKFMLYDMRATIIKLIGELNSDMDIGCLEYDRNNKYEADKVFNEIKLIYKNICNRVNQNKKSHNNSMIVDMQAFIISNYTDSNLSVCAIASNFNISESYFSQFFKEQTGDNFSNYLEDLRIKYACRLIKETDYTIDEIALKIGYNNSRTFRRAFKKVIGVAPSSYS